MVEDKLPKNWLLVSLEQINLRKSKNIVPNNYPNETFESYSVPVFETGKPEFVTGKEIKSSKQAVKTNDVLLCKINPRINRVWIVKDFSSFQKIGSSEWIVVNTQNIISAKFLMYIFSAPEFRVLMQQDVSGVGGSLTRARPQIVNKYKFPLPPRPEQDRIVAKVDTLMAQVEIMQKSLERIPQLLKDFRQQVLTQAVTGKLTEEWREGKEIKEWKNTTIGQLFDVRTGATPKRGNPNYHENGSIPWLKSGQVKNEFIYSAEEFITDIAIKETNTKIYPIDTLLVAMYGEGKTRGQVGWMKIEAASNQAIAALVNEEMDIKTKQYIYYYCLSQYNEIRSKAEGGNQPNLSLSKIKNWEIKIPQFEEQQEIVRRVESLFTKADKIEQQYKTLKDKIETLPQAILNKAFKGELVEQLESDGDARDLLREIGELKKSATTKKPSGKTVKLKSYSQEKEVLGQVAEEGRKYER